MYPQDLKQGGIALLYFCCAYSYVAICRATNSGCSASNPVQRDWQSGYRRSLRYRIEMVQVSEWTEGGLICGALPADCAPAGYESFWQ